MAFKQDKFRSIGEFLGKLGAVYKNKAAVWFRGQAVAKWQLQPSIMRPPHSADDEVVLLKKFKQNAVPLIDAVPNREADWLFLMQHHSVPTRLLDWTESPLVALYFAVAEARDAKHRKKDAALWCLYPHASVLKDSGDIWGGRTLWWRAGGASACLIFCGFADGSPAGKTA